MSTEYEVLVCHRPLLWALLTNKNRHGWDVIAVLPRNSSEYYGADAVAVVHRREASE